MNGGDDDQRDERTTSLKNVCWLYYLSVVFFLWLLSLWSPTCWLCNNDEEDGGGNDGTSGQHRRRTYVGYTTCLWFVFVVVVISFVSHMLHGYGGGTTRRRMVATTMGREDNITEESKLAMLPVCCLLLFFCLFVVSACWLMAEGQLRGGCIKLGVNAYGKLQYTNIHLHSCSVSIHLKH